MSFLVNKIKKSAKIKETNTTITTTNENENSPNEPI